MVLEQSCRGVEVRLSLSDSGALLAREDKQDNQMGNFEGHLALGHAGEQSTAREKVYSTRGLEQSTQEAGSW